MRPHAGGIYNYIDIHASLATDSNAFVNMWIKPGSESISNMTYDGWFAYRSSSYWFQGNCRFTIIENTGSQGNLRGIGTCDKLTDNKYDTQETKMISDLEFNIKMLGDISPVE